MTLAQIQYSAKSESFVFLTLAQIQYSAKSESFVFPETSDKFSFQGKCNLFFGITGLFHDNAPLCEMEERPETSV
ncbi:hypothetical protein C6H72_16375 [Salmonella enterica subsp. diarizonae serovar 48:i:z]|nr:hypothetical protein C6H72_16375 [Salmonella enterica subsp. diarizonae serovar 48:i:z]RLR23654.1 hypothetical protein C6H71_24200 [Salmonella enterica subsp. diarizonae serovar 48:i:z]